MASAKKHHPTSKPSKNPSTSTTTESLSIEGSERDSVLRISEFLTREEVLRRRSRRVNQLERLYREQYWSLMEEVRVKYRDYSWKFGKSPFVEEEEEHERKEGVGETNNQLGLGFGDDHNNSNNDNQCVFSGCKSKAMASTRFCHPHILSDKKQKLYKACTYVLKSAQTGQVTCGKPVLRAAVPSLCTVHFQKAQIHVSRALKKAGLNSSSSNKPAPKFHVIVAEYVRRIQAKRREAQCVTLKNVVLKEENVH